MYVCVKFSEGEAEGVRWQILTLGPTPPWPGVRRGMLKDKSKFSRFIHLMGMHLMGVYLTGLYLTGTHLMSVHLMSMHLIYESSLRVGHGWRESLYRHPGWLKKLLIVGDSAVRLLITLGARSAW